MTGRVFVSIAAEPDSPSPFGCVTLLHIRQRRTSQSGRHRFISGPGYYTRGSNLYKIDTRANVQLYHYTYSHIEYSIIVHSYNIRKRSVLNDRSI